MTRSELTTRTTKTGRPRNPPRASTALSIILPFGFSIDAVQLSFRTCRGSNGTNAAVLFIRRDAIEETPATHVIRQSGVDGINSSLARRQMTCVSINSTTTTSGTPSNQRMTGIFVSFFQLHQQFLGQKIVPSICARWATPKDVCLGPMADNLSLRKITLMSDLKNVSRSQKNPICNVQKRQRPSYEAAN